MTFFTTRSSLCPNTFVWPKILKKKKKSFSRNVLKTCGRNLQYMIRVANPFSYSKTFVPQGLIALAPELYTVEPQWLEHLWDHGYLFETWVVRATEVNHGTSSGSE